MTYNNFSISSSKGKLYLKEKNPTEGYTEVLYGVEGKSKTYHKYFDSIKGIPTLLEQKEISYEGRTLRFLELKLVDGDVENKVSVSLKNKGGYTDEVKAILSALNGLETGKEVTLTTKISKYQNRRGEEKSQLNIYVNYTEVLNDSGKGLSTGFIHNSEIPRPVEKVVAGDTVWDWTEQTEFYYKKLTEISTRISGTPAAPAQPAAPATTKAPATVQPAATKTEFTPFEEVADDDDDDLPF